MAWHDGEHAVFALDEAARILSVWGAHGFADTSESVLMQWALATASLGGRIPQPRLGLDVLAALGIARSADPVGGLSFGFPERGLDQFLLFEQLWQSQAASEQMQSILGHFRHGTGPPEVNWATVSTASRRLPGWVWLQRLGLVVRDGGRLIADPRLQPYLLETSLRAAFGENELLQRLERQRVRAALAEDFVVVLEKRRLSNAGRHELADGVERVSERNVSAGFDIQSFELNGRPRLVEVKSSAGACQRFFISSNEVKAAERHRNRYVLAWVGHAARLPDGVPEVLWYRDPWALFQDPTGPFVLSTASWEVSLRR